MAPSTTLSRSRACMAGSSTLLPDRLRVPRGAGTGRLARWLLLGLGALLGCRDRIEVRPSEALGGAEWGGQGGERATCDVPSDAGEGGTTASGGAAEGGA